MLYALNLIVIVLLMICFVTLNRLCLKELNLKKMCKTMKSLVFTFIVIKKKLYKLASSNIIMFGAAYNGPYVLL